jgi:hypothetical protein
VTAAEGAASTCERCGKSHDACSVSWCGSLDGGAALDALVSQPWERFMVSEAVRGERARIVEWIRVQAKAIAALGAGAPHDWRCMAGAVEHTLSIVADSIAANEHGDGS